MTMNFILSNTNEFFSNNNESETSLLTTSESQASQSASILAPSSESDCGVDAFGGKDLFGTCDISNISEGFFANTSIETAGSMAFGGAETAGSVAFGGAETAGSVASSSFGGGFSCGASSGASAGGGCGGFSSVC